MDVLRGWVSAYSFKLACSMQHKVHVDSPLSLMLVGLVEMTMAIEPLDLKLSRPVGR